ncbi:MAG: YSC84-like protein 1 [Synergistaceae bacterium]|nr:YSC84-like protein 1 [Synergistaceae bacterium]
MMKRNTRMFLATVFSFVLIFWAGSAGKAFAAAPKGLIQDSVTILREMSAQEDAGTMGDLLQQARGVAIFPSVLKAAFVFGAQYGEGLVLRRDNNTGNWYGPSFASVTGVSYGLQIGAQSISLVLVITNDDGFKGFMENNVTLGGDIAVAAGPVGRRGELGTDYKFDASIYSYSMTKGLFAGVSLKGASVGVSEQTNKDYWGKSITAENALGRRASSADMQPLIKELNKLIRESK